MSHNQWRLSGGLGIVPDPVDPNQEVMTQGLGFPLRPIDNVPLDDSPTVPEGVVADGLFMQWMGNWNAGLYYPRGSYVRDGTTTAIANKLTLEKPAPIPDPANPESTGLPDPWTGVTTQSNISVIVSGQTYTFAESGWIKELKVWAPELTANTNYRIVIVNLTDPESPITTIIEEPVLVEDEWKIISLLNEIVPVGTVLRIGLDALNSSAATNISGGWQYGGQSQTAPLAQQWNQSNQRDAFRISKTDLDGTDRSAELEGVIPDSTISAVQTDSVGNTVAYRVTSVTDSGTYMTYGVTLQSETGAIAIGATTTLDISIPIPLPTEYAEETLVWGTPPSWATSVEGFLEFDGVDQAVPVTNAYGVDILFEPASISEDWDLITTS